MKSIDWLNVARCSASRLHDLRQSGEPIQEEEKTLEVAIHMALYLKNQEIERNFKGKPKQNQNENNDSSPQDTD